MSPHLILSIFSLLWLLLLTLSLRKALSHYKTLSRIKKGVSLDTLLEQIVKTLSRNQKVQRQSDEKIGHLEQEIKNTISKVGLVKFNPFNDQGGKQSFVLSFLDSNNSGLLITSLHARDGTRVYTKKVEKGKAKSLQLSKEEKMSILSATRKT